MKILLIFILMLGMPLNFLQAETWEDIKAKCDQGAVYSIQPKGKDFFVTVSLGKSSSEEIFMAKLNGDFEILSFLHIVRSYSLSEDQKFSPATSLSVKFHRFSVKSLGAPPTIDNLTEVGENLSARDAGDLLERFKSMLKIIKSASEK